MNMKLIITGIILISITEFTFSQSGWFWQHPKPQGNIIMCVTFINENTGVAGTFAGTIIRTTNSGLNWNMVFVLNPNPIHDDFIFYDIEFINETTGFCIDQWGTMVKTTNEGQNWFKVQTNFAAAHDISFIDNHTGFIIEGFEWGRYWKTTDEGNSWTLGNFGINSNLNRIHFINSTTGFVGGSDSTILRTSNAGNNWNRISLNDPDFISILDFNFVNQQTGYCSGSGGKIFMTTNSGLNWFLQETNVTFNLDFIHFYELDYGLAGGTNSKMLKTTNGGLNWNLFSNGNNLDMFCYGKANDSVGVICGVWGLILRTSDYGNTWKRVSDTILQTFTGIKFVNNNTGYACGNEGILFKTTNKGVEWNSYQNFSSNLKDMFFISNNIGFMLASNRIYKTTNSGENWIQNNFNLNLKTIYFINELTGYSCGEISNIYKTTNSGLNWYRSDSSVSGRMTNIHFKDANTGIAGGDSIVLRTTNAGINWYRIPNLNINIVRDINYQHGKFIILGGWNGNYLTSTDDGSSWDQQLFTPGTINQSLRFSDSLTGLMVCIGGDYFILKTTNAGQSWNLLRNITYNGLSEIYSIDNLNSFIIGSYGTIIATTDGGGEIMTGISNTNVHLPDLFHLKQNYPNPFNPNTKIDFDLPEDGKVSLIIYDILGKRMMTILNNEFKSVGSHSVEFNGVNLSSGIYFYRLEVNNFVQTKRMVLIK